MVAVLMKYEAQWVAGQNSCPVDDGWIMNYLAFPLDIGLGSAQTDAVQFCSIIPLLVIR